MLNPKVYFILFALFINFSGNAQDLDLIQKLTQEIPSVQIVKLQSSDHFIAEYEIMIPQMIDHNDPKAGYFNQRIFLSHYNDNSPTLIVTEGYSARDVCYEIAKELKTNQIIVEYRYFGKSIPKSVDWKYLTNAQAMKDIHHIRDIFSNIYKNKNWISTGISKGGTTCLFYKAAYPKDVRIAIPYVGPMPNSPEDKRCDEHLLTIGSDECRSALINFQKRALDQRTQIIPKIDSMAIASKKLFSMGYDKVLEYSVLELSFSFWQYAHECSEIPESSTPDESFQYLSSISGFDFYSDATINQYKPAFFQFITENGYYGFLHEHLSNRIIALDKFDNSYFAPQDANLSFHPDYMNKAVKKLKRKKRILQIQGELDPWSACGLKLMGKDQYYFIKEGGSHSTRINSFNSEQQDKIWTIIKGWMI